MWQEKVADLGQALAFEDKINKSNVEVSSDYVMFLPINIYIYAGTYAWINESIYSAGINKWKYIAILSFTQWVHAGL